MGARILGLVSKWCSKTDELLSVNEVNLIPRLWIHIWLVEIYICCGEGMSNSSTCRGIGSIKQTAGFM